MAYTYQGPKQFQSKEPNGMIDEVVQGLRAIPHLPAALISGVDDPKATQDERDMRRRALSEASQWVLPLVVSGAAAAIPATGGASVLISAVADAAGWGLGNAGAAALNGEDPVSAGIGGALMGGGLGAAGGLLKLGGKAAAEGLAENAAKDAASADARNSARWATEATDFHARNQASELARGAPGTQPDLFDFGMSPEQRQNVGGVLPLDQRTPPNDPQLNMFADHPDFPASLPDKAIYAKVYENARGGGPWFTASTPIGPRGVVEATAQRAAGETPSQAIAALEETGSATPKAPKTFDSKPPAGGGMPKTPPVDELQALHGMTPGILDPKPEAPTKIGIPRGYAADQVLKGALADAASSIMRGDLTGLGKAAGRVAQAAKLSDTWQQLSAVVSRAVEPARKTLQRMGAAGTELAAKLDGVYQAWREGAGDHMATVIKALDGYNKADRVHIMEVIEGLAVPKTISHGNAANTIRDVLSWYPDEAEKMGFRQLMEDGSTRDFTRMTNFAPHILDGKAIDKILADTGSPQFQAIHDRLRGLGQSGSQAETSAFLRLIRKTPSEFRTGALNFSRSKLDLPYEKDPLVAIPRYIFDTRKRIEIARAFGAGDKGLLPYLDRIKMDGGDSKVAANIYAAFAGSMPQQYTKLLRAVSTYNTWTMLSTAGIVQPAQLLNTAAVTSYANTFRAIGAYLKDPKMADYMATRAGVHINEVLQDLAGGASTDANSWFMHAILLEPLDKANRVVSALAGRFHLDQLAEQFSKAGLKQQSALGARIEALGVSPAELVSEGFKPTEKMYRDAAYRVSTSTQHTSGVMDLPEFKNHTVGKILYQFRSFALQQAGFMEKELFRPMRKGNIAPITRYAIGLGPSGAAMGQIVHTLTGRPTPDAPTTKMVESMALAGGFGIYYDTINAMVSGKDRFLSFLAGPSVSELAAYAGDLGDTFQGKPEVLGNHLVRRLPIIGQPLSNYWFNPK